MKLPEAFNNKITKWGIIISVISFVVIIPLLVFAGEVEEWSVAGILTFVGFTILWIIGLIMIPWGISKTEKKNSPDKKSRMLDLTNPAYKNAFYVFLSVLVVFLVVFTAGAYKSYHYIESEKFCGTTCHVTMEPEYVAHEKMAHANVKCADCHIGEGVTGFINSKIEASKEFIAIITNTVPHPIYANDDIEEVAKEACQQCHWSQKFVPDRKVHHVHFLRDEDNTQWNIDLTLHLASGNEPLGISKGVHWHMNKDVKIEYVALDKNKQEIPWVRYTDLKTGKVTVFQNEDEPLNKDAFDTLKVVQMTCVDCHNRPAHKFYPAETFINEAFVRGEIDRTLPEFKSAAVSAVSDEEYTNADTAKMMIRKQMLDFYEENYPEVLEEKKDALNKSIDGLIHAFSQNVFPNMHVRWDKYYDNIGHMKSNGCFRCHDNNHVAQNDEVIPKKCTTCHSIDAQGTPGEMQYAKAGSPLEFLHPGGEVEKEDWEEGLCSDCHAGTGP